MEIKLVTRVERHSISKAHPMFDVCDEYCFKSKNLYNYVNYMIRQEFIENNKYLSYNNLAKQVKHDEPFTEMGSNSAQLTMRSLDKNWKSFFEASREYSKQPNKFLGKPKIPKYKNKNGRHVFMLTNLQTRVEQGFLYFAFKAFKPYNNVIKTQIKGRLMQTRIVPKGGSYILEVVYETEVPSQKKCNGGIIGVDLGLNNFATIVNNIGEKPIVVNGKGIKSYNQYWNKKTSHYKSLAKINNGSSWTKRLQALTRKRGNKLDYFMHCASRYIIDYCKELEVNTIVIGYNEYWKQNVNLGKSTQDFVQVPHYEFIEKLSYKCEDSGISLKITEESYTSGTSFLDNEEPKKENYDISRRVSRGLFKSNCGTLINSDVNAAYQIIKKVFPKAFVDGIVGVGLHPLVVNI